MMSVKWWIVAVLCTLVVVELCDARKGNRGKQGGAKKRRKTCEVDEDCRSGKECQMVTTKKRGTIGRCRKPCIDNVDCKGKKRDGFCFIRQDEQEGYCRKKCSVDDDCVKKNGKGRGRKMCTIAEGDNEGYCKKKPRQRGRKNGRKGRKGRREIQQGGGAGAIGVKMLD